jgi:hypothetical protein
MVLSWLKRIWWSWKRLVHQLNAVISFVLMAFVYIVAVAPVALGFRIFKPDPTDRGLGDPQRKSFWLEVRLGREDIQRAQRPW